jgi:O-antigen/teichoic acid export membrane protein
MGMENNFMSTWWTRGLLKRGHDFLHNKSEKVYVVFNWTASIVAFLSMMMIYRFSPSISAAGNNGWLLMLLNASLFVSAAAEYYVLFRNKEIVYAYMMFLPIIVIEILLLFWIVDFFIWVFISICIISNVFVAAFRGHFMAQRKLTMSSVITMCEQICRGILVMLFILFGNEITISIVVSSGIVYLFMASIVFIYVFRKEPMELKISVFNKENFMDGIKFSLVCLGIYFLMNGDALALKNVISELKGEFNLLKPWGQIVLTILMPFLNIFLIRMKHKEGVWQIVLIILTGLIAFVFIGYYWGMNLNECIFHKTLNSSKNLTMLIVEHFFIMCIVAFLYRLLDIKQPIGRLIMIVGFNIIGILMIPYFIQDGAIFFFYMVFYMVEVFVLLMISFLKKHFGRRQNDGEEALG